MSALFPAIVAPVWALSSAYAKYAFVRDADGATWQANAAIPANTAFAEGFDGATWRRIADSGVAMAALYLKANVLPGVIGKGAAADLSPAYVEDKLAASEAQAARDLRTYLAPTQVFAGEPTAAEVDALNGAAYAVETAYDYNWESIFPTDSIHRIVGPRVRSNDQEDTEDHPYSQALPSNHKTVTLR